MKKGARAHTNIALIKYWGKANPSLRLPLMSSLSLTLDAFYTDTFISKANKMEFVLNGKRQNGKAAERVFAYVKKLQQHFGLSGKLKIESTNHVPTAAGLASSSSAFAALAASFCSFYDLKINKKELSRLARLGSGSACRSVFGGFVVWQKGHDNDSSFAYPLDEQPKMDLQLLAVEVDAKPKKLSSTNGMEHAKTSPFYQIWLDRNDSEMQAMIAAIKANDFTKLGSLAELNANEMHAINLTSQPEFTYFEEKTIRAIKLVEKLRAQGIECYYTIDAGPNLKILTQLKNVKDIEKNFLSEFNNVNIIHASFGPGISYLK